MDRRVFKSSIVKHSVKISGQLTSLSLENEFWDQIKAIAAEKEVTVAGYVESVDRARQNGNLSSALRVAAFRFIKDKLARA